jgi:hypothetical protein
MVVAIGIALDVKDMLGRGKRTTKEVPDVKGVTR